MNLTDAIGNLKTEMMSGGIEPENGLGTELFLFSSTLVPIVNVDLLIFKQRTGTPVVEGRSLLRNGLAYSWKLYPIPRINGASHHQMRTRGDWDRVN